MDALSFGSESVIATAFRCRNASSGKAFVSRGAWGRCLRDGVGGFPIRLGAGMLALLCLAVSPVAWAQTPQSYGPDQKFLERVNPARKLGPLKVDQAFGESINLYDGSVAFNTVDISVPGNDDLPVELRRSFTVDNRWGGGGTHLGGFGNWDLDIAHLSGVFLEAAGLWSTGGNGAQRCSQPGPPPWAGTMSPHDYWNGYNLHIPGGGDQSLLMDPSATLPSSQDGIAYPWITKRFWKLSCKNATANGYPGQAFIALSPDGVKYHLDWVVTKSYPSYRDAYATSQATSPSVYPRKLLFFLVSRIEDRFGNWVSYSYSGDRLASIQSSDGRLITLGYSGDKVVSATANGRTWGYGYTQDSLTLASQPDQSRWAYSPGYPAITPPPPPPPYEDPSAQCPEPLSETASQFNFTVVNPANSQAVFSFDVLRHYKNNVPKLCESVGNAPQFLHIPNYYDSFTLMQKQVSGAGLPGMTWSYTYGNGGPIYFADQCQNPDPQFCAPSKTHIVQGPDGVYERYEYGILYSINDGQLLKHERGSGPSVILRSETHGYFRTQEHGAQIFPAEVGTNPQEYSDRMATAELRPQLSTTTEESQAQFTWSIATCGSQRCFDVFARPLQRLQQSSLGYSRTQGNEYHDDYVHWVLGQDKRRTINTTEVARTDFNAMSQPWKAYRFGKLQQTFAYNADGTLQSAQDGRNHVTNFSQWKRGVPRQIQYPDGTTESATVDHNGWITAITDENGYSTGYGYDSAGRLSGITYPANDTVAYFPRSIYTSALIASDWMPPGVQAGQWRRHESAGSYTHITYYDTLWRPLLVHEYDANDVPNTLRATRYEYDHEGRTTFQSYTGSDLVPGTSGLHHRYDAIGRKTLTEQDSELGVLRTWSEYLSGLRVRETNPRSFASVQSYLAYDQPDYSLLVRSEQPENKVVEIARNALGQPTGITQRSADSSVSATRRYVYDGYQQLCKTIEPETGSTVMEYDAADNPVWSAAGLALPDAANCNRNEAYASGRRVDRSYDSRNRLATLAFPDGRGNQTLTYWPDGLPRQVTTQNDGNADGTVVNLYGYNKRRLLTSEQLQRPYTWTLGYGYDALGNLSTQSYPNNTVVSYQPNALGQPSGVQETGGQVYAANVRYHPSGQLKAFDYGNGVAHATSLNARQLVSTQSDAGVTRWEFGYDANGNIEHIYDTLDPGSNARSRWMGYDTLDRLTTAGSASFGGGTWNYYSYDALDNLRSSTLAGVRDYASYVYDAGNRLVRIDNSAGSPVVTLGYDVQGNLSSHGSRTYGFDYGNRLRNSPEEWYRYDAQGRRITAQRHNGPGVASIYSLAGQLVYDEDALPGARRSDSYFYLGGRLIAQKMWHWDTNQTTVEFRHADYQGTRMADSGSAGQVLRRQFWQPYGQPVDNPAFDGLGYTGHKVDAATGLIYMQQRYYDPQIGRFLSVDPVAAYSKKGILFNRYWYANNNPYKFTDPDGWESACFSTGLGCGLRPYTEEDNAKVAVAMGGLMGIAALAIPDPTDIALGAAIGRFALGLRAERGFSHARRYIEATYENMRKTGGSSGQRTTEFDGGGGAEGAKKLFDRLTGGKSEARDGGRLGSLGDGARVQTSTRTLKDGTKETSVRISVQREGSRIKDNIKVRF